jgi:hypothetical protein
LLAVTLFFSALPLFVGKKKHGDLLLLNSIALRLQMAETTLLELLQHHQLFCAADAMTLPLDTSPPLAPLAQHKSLILLFHPALPHSYRASFMKHAMKFT